MWLAIEHEHNINGAVASQDRDALAYATEFLFLPMATRVS